ncbi:MAG: ATPase, partial [Spirochaetaceae bacterium]|nr:ATPase [Spirochaetaceae bacterium]
MDWKATTAQAVLDELGVTVSNGLSAGEVQSRLEQYGPNELAEGGRKTTLQRLAEQFKSALIYILLVAAAVSAAVGEITDAVIIFAIVLLNAVIGVVQEGRAEQALEALKKMASPKAVVRRDGRAREVEAAELVPGDTVILEAGRVVPADI